MYQMIPVRRLDQFLDQGFSGTIIDLRSPRGIQTLSSERSGEPGAGRAFKSAGGDRQNDSGAVLLLQRKREPAGRCVFFADGLPRL